MEGKDTSFKGWKDKKALDKKKKLEKGKELWFWWIKLI
jgi:hypothetical protein